MGIAGRGGGWRSRRHTSGYGGRDDIPHVADTLAGCVARFFVDIVVVQREAVIRHLAVAVIAYERAECAADAVELRLDTSSS